MKKIILLWLLFVNISWGKTELFEKLQAIEGVEIETYNIGENFVEAYRLMIEQPVNHLCPNGAKFKQEVFISHTNFNKPMVVVTEGYQAYGKRHSELSEILKCNEIIIEHRYFGESIPSPRNWRYLTVEQAAADHHRIIQIFKKIYKGKFITTGVSKGGQTALFHRAYYPKDVDITVPYVAPLNLEQEERRLYPFINKLGNKNIQEKIINFQKHLLEHRDNLLPLFKKYCDAKELKFNYDLNLIYEYVIFEYPFAFWQWRYFKDKHIPTSQNSNREIIEHLVSASPPSFFDIKEMEDISAFMYQAYTEIGFYGYDTTPFKPLLKGVQNDFATNAIFAPAYGKLFFNPETMKFVSNFIKNYGNNILYIYGDADPWYACAVEIGNKTNALKMVKKEGSHRTRIKNFSPENKGKIYATLYKWLEYK